LVLAAFLGVGPRVVLRRSLRAAVGARRSSPIASLAMRRARPRVDRQVRREMPMIVDLVRIAVGAGSDVRSAVVAAARANGGPIADELDAMERQIVLGARFTHAASDLARRLPAARGLVSTLVSAERYGAPALDGLERLAADLRAAQQREAQRAAQRLSVLMVFPVAGLFLPAFALMSVAPLLAGAFGSLAASFH